MSSANRLDIRDKPKLVYILGDSFTGLDYERALISALGNYFEVLACTPFHYTYEGLTKDFQNVYLLDGGNLNGYDIAWVEREVQFGLGWLIKATRGLYPCMPRRMIQSQACHGLASFIPIVHKFRPDVLLMAQGLEPYKIAIYLYARKLGISTLFFGGGGYVSNGMLLYDNWINHLLEIEDDCDGRVQSHESTAVDMRLDKKVITYETQYLRPSIFHRISYYRLIHYWMYVSFNIRKALLDITRLPDRLFYASLPTKPEGQKYVLFAMNLPEDSTLQLRNYTFRDQVKVIESLLDFLPPQITLVVKGHPGRLNAPPMKTIRLLWRRNCILLNRNIPATDVMNDIDYVIVQASSVGIEAVQRRIPVGVIGYWELAQIPGMKTFDLTTPEGYYRLVDDILHRKELPDPNEVKKKLASIHYPGTFFPDSGRKIDTDFYLVSKSIYEKYIVLNCWKKPTSHL